MLLRDKFTGTGVAIITPFTQDGKIDWSAFENVITDQNADKVQAKVILELANGPVTPEADEILFKKKRCLLSVAELFLAINSSKYRLLSYNKLGDFISVLHRLSKKEILMSYLSQNPLK